MDLKVFLVLLLLTASTAAAEPDGGADALPACPHGDGFTNVFRGHAFRDSLFCAAGGDLTRGAIGSRFLPNGCLLDIYSVSCGSQTFSLEVEPGKPLPKPPAGLLLAERAVMEKYRLAQKKLDDKAPGEAIAALDAAIARDKRIPHLWRLRGLAKFANKRPALAVRDLDQALALAPRWPLLRLEHAQVQGTNGQAKKAIAELQALEKDQDPSWPYWGELLTTIASGLKQIGDPASATYKLRACAAGVKWMCSASPDGGAADAASD